MKFSRVQISLNSKKSIFLPKFRKFISRKRAEIFWPNFQDLYALGISANRNLKSRVGPTFGHGEGQMFQRAPVPGPLAAKLYYVGPGLNRTLDNRLPYNTFPRLAIIPETFSPGARQSGLRFWNFNFYFEFRGLPYPHACEYRPIFYGDV